VSNATQSDFEHSADPKMVALYRELDAREEQLKAELASVRLDKAKLAAEVFGFHFQKGAE
jgi:hypothetical protein